MAISQVQSVVASNYFASFFNKAKQIQERVKTIPNKQYNYVPLAYVSRGVTKEPKILRLSEDTLVNKKLVHVDIGIKEYTMVQDIISTGYYNISKKAYIKKIGKYYYLVATKLTKDNELLMNSFYKIREEQFMEWTKK